MVKYKATFEDGKVAFVTSNLPLNDHSVVILAKARNIKSTLSIGTVIKTEEIPNIFDNELLSPKSLGLIKI